MKTYTREELKQLEGKRVRCKFTYPKNDFTIIGILIIHHNNLHIGGAGAICIKNEYNTGGRNYQFELLENEFEVGEEVEVRDEEDGIRQPRIYLCTVPGNTRYPHIVVDCRFIEEYSKGKIFLNEDFRYIRKKEVQEKILEVTMKDICEKYGCNVKIIDDK